MSKEERYAEHTVAFELPKCDTVTKGNYNLADIEMKYMPIQTEVVSDSKDKIIADLQSQLAITEKALELACEPRDDWGGREYSGTEYDNYYDYFMAQAKEMLENESK